jgi:RNA polymerase sigma factor (sigma-70 family)
MTKTTKKLRVASNEDIKEAQKDMNNVRIINKCLSKYAFCLDPDELHECGLHGLWKALEYHDYSRQKFTNSLYTHVRWACLIRMRDKRKYKKTLSLDMLPDNGMDAYEDKSFDMVDMQDAIDSLTSREKKMMTDYFVNNKTMKEIGLEVNLCKERVRQKINGSLKVLNKIYSE